MASLADQEKETNNFSYAMELASAIVLPAVMQAVVELDVFEIISKAGPGAKLSVAEIVAQIPLKDNNPEAAAMTLDRVLRLLVSYNALHCSFVDGQRLYSLAPVSAYFVRNNQNGASLSPYMALCLDKVCLDGWFGLKKQILEGGIAFNKAHGMQIYDYLGVDSRFNDVFNNGMLSHTSIVMEKVLESYKGFEHVKKLVDVGGGLGTVLLVQLPHGRERTKQEYTELAVKAGFKGVNYDYGVCNLYVMEFFK